MCHGARDAVGAAYPGFLCAQASRFRARLAAVRGDRESVDDPFKGAAALFRELETPFPLAVTQLEYAEWLSSQSRRDEAEPLLAEARGAFERLAAKPWLERAAKSEEKRQAEAVPQPLSQ